MIDKHEPAQIGTDTDWATVSAAGGHTVALKNGGSLWSWGNNEYGQLGDGSTIDKHEPVQIGTDTDWRMASARGSFTVALKADGTLWAWGNNNYSQLGDGTTVHKVRPVQIGTDTDWASISVGSRHTIALKADGTLWAWGNNDFGQLGYVSYSVKRVPVQIGAENNWVSVSAGALFSTALKADGSLWTWGYNNYGQLGDGSTIGVSWPVQVGRDTDWSSVFVGWGHVLALKENGSLWGWGDNSMGQLGDGTTMNRNVPSTIGKGTDWISGSAGGSHSMFIKKDENTLLPTLHAPLNDRYNGQNIEVSFSLPETAKTGTVKLSFSRMGGAEDIHAPHVIILDTPFEAAAQHWLNLDGSSLGAAADVIAVNSAPNDALMNEAIYSVSISYEDQYGHAAAVDASDNFIYDAISPVLLTREASIKLNAEGVATLTVENIDAGTTDNLTAHEDLSFSFSQSVFGVEEVGIHQVTVTVADQAGNSSSAVVVVEVTESGVTGLFGPEQQPLVVYPNPTKGPVTLKLENEMAGENIRVSLFDLQGKQLLQQQGSLEEGMKKVNAYLEKTAAGMYLLQLQRKDKVLRVKVMKE